MKRIVYFFLALVLVSCKANRQQVCETDQAQLFSDSDLVRETPLTRIAVTSATHIGFLKALDRLDVVVAMTSPDLIYNKPEQAVADIGEDINLNLEQLLLVQPEAILITNYGQPLPNIDRIKAAGIEVIELQEWKEQTPLARADWIRYFGALVGEKEKADSIIASVRHRYHQLSATYAHKEEREGGRGNSIMSGASFRGTWYVPSGGTYMGRLFKDAGADYPYYNDMRQASIPLTFEAVLQQFGNADVWVGCNARTYAELLALDEHHAWFRAYQTQQVYNWYKLTTPTGANNFWERGIVHPDEMLEDLMTILYAQPDELHYAAPLE